MKNWIPLLLLALFAFSWNSCSEEAVHPGLTETDVELRSSTIVQHADLLPFQPSGKEGGLSNVLPVGVMYPPTNGGTATLKRGDNYIQFNMHTTGLPPGAYTVWYVFFNETGDCTNATPLGACGEGDLGISTMSIVWATGKVVKSNGIGNFSDRIYVGEQRSETFFIGDELSSPLTNPDGVEVHLIVKYHGPASDDPAILHEQLTTLLGSCGPDDGANSHLTLAFGYQCFDPQFAIIPAP